MQRMSTIASSLQMFMAQRPSGTTPTEISQTSLFGSSVSHKPCLLDSAVCITLLFCSSVYSTYAELLGERDCDFSIRDPSPPYPSFSLSVCLLVIVLPPQSGQSLDLCWTSGPPSFNLVYKPPSFCLKLQGFPILSKILFKKSVKSLVQHILCNLDFFPWSLGVLFFGQLVFAHEPSLKP